MATSGWFDPEALEVERQDADMEMAELERQGREASRLRKRGICLHGWRQGRTLGNGHLCPPELAAAPVGSVMCLEPGCGRLFTSNAEADADARASRNRS